MGSDFAYEAHLPSPNKLLNIARDAGRKEDPWIPGHDAQRCLSLTILLGKSSDRVGFQNSDLYKIGYS